MAKKAKKPAVKNKSKTSKAPARKTASKTSTVKAKSRQAVAKPSTTASSKKSAAPAAADRVLEYKLFTEDSVRNLEDQVNYHIKKGWSPVGGVVLQGQNTFMQTMVRRED